MRLDVQESSEYSEVEVIIRCPMMDSELNALIDHIRMYGFAIKCHKDDSVFMVKPSEIYYIESIDDKTFVYCKEEVYSCDMRLYALEERLRAGMFTRVSKSCILNMNMLKGFKGQLNGKLEAHMTNGERIEVSRHYVPELKKRLQETGAQK